MSTDLALYDSPTASALALVGPANELVGQLANTTFVPREYRGKPAELLAAVLTGHELGVGPMAAMSKIHNIQGRAGVSAELMRAVVLSKGHQIWVEETTATKVTVAGHRAGAPERVSRFSWTIDMAKTAGLAGKEVWRKYPQAMLMARATGELCRAIFADCLSGISYTTEELEDGFIDEGSGEVEVGAPDGVAPAPPAGNRRSIPAKKAAAKKAAARPAPAPAAEPADPMDDFDDIEQVAAGAPAAKSVEERRTAMVNIRVKEVLGDLDRDERLAFLTASTGRLITSSKQLTSEDVDRVVVDLDAIKAGERAWVSGQLVDEAVLEDDEPASDPVEDPAPPAPAEAGGWGDLDDEDWKESVRQAGVKVVDVLRQAAALAQELGVEAPASVAGMAEADPALKAAVGAWLQGQSS